VGYRSSVAYTIRFTPDSGDMTQEKLKGAFAVFLEEATANEDTKLCFTQEEAREFIKVDREGCAINFFASDVKWYEDYTDVKCHIALLEMVEDWLAEDNPHSKYLGYIFVRIGESPEDIIEECGGNYDWDWLSVSRSINCDWFN